MLGKFINDLNQLLNDNKYEFVDAEPLLEKHFGHLSFDEEAKYRLNAQNEIRQMQRDGLVLFKNGYFVITKQTPHKYSFLKSTRKFDKELNRQQPIRQNILSDIDKKENAFISFIKNNWTVTIIGGIIVTLICAYILHKLGWT